MYFNAIAYLLLFGAVFILAMLQVIEMYERRESEAHIKGLADENRRLREENRALRKMLDPVD